MKRRNLVILFVCFLVLMIAGCDGGGGSKGDDGSNGGGNGTEKIIIKGTVFNNYTDADITDKTIAGASVVLIKAEDVQAFDSLSPVEDLASIKNRYPTAITDSGGNYQFATSDFSDTYPAKGKYFVFVDPSVISYELLPGGSESRKSILLDGVSETKLDITLTDTTGPNAEYIGSMLCLLCHQQKSNLNHTLHFVGIRKIGSDGTIVNDLMNMTDTSVYDLSKNSDKILEKFTIPATQYTFEDDTAKSFWLGKDAAGLYFQLTSNANPKFYVKYGYGGETGKWRGLFMTTVYDGDGTYAADHGQIDDDYAYFVFAPFQYNEASDSINGETFVTYHAEKWDFAGTKNKGFTEDPEVESFDLACAGCHGAVGVKTINTGLVTEKRIAVFPRDDGGYELDGSTAQINVGCEKCHGPGSSHLAAGGNGRMIISPRMLPPGRLTMICGSCHIRGENNTDVGGGVPLEADGSGNYETFKPGMTPARFFGTPDGTGKNVAPFGTANVAALSGNGYLEPINFETDTDASWRDLQFGAVVNHSKSSQQQYADFVRSSKYGNNREILTCISCHDAHGSGYEHMVKNKTDNNAVCLSCHSGSGQLFPNVNQAIIDRIKADMETQTDKNIIGQDVETHIFDKTGTLQMGPYDPEGTAMGRCVLCHMSKTAKSADWRFALETQLGQYVCGDISSHSFDVMATVAINEMAEVKGPLETTPAGITDKCGSCHRFAGLN